MSKRCTLVGGTGTEDDEEEDGFLRLLLLLLLLLAGAVLALGARAMSGMLLRKLVAISVTTCQGSKVRQSSRT